MGTRYVVQRGPITERVIFDARCIGCKRYTAMGVVEVPVIDIERESTDGIVIAACCIVYKGSRSNGCVEGAGGVEKQGCSANCRILISRIESQRPSAKTRVEAVSRDGRERKPAKGCIRRAGG